MASYAVPPPGGRILDIETQALCVCGRYPTHLVLRLATDDGKPWVDGIPLVHVRGYCHSCSPYVSAVDKGYVPGVLAERVAGLPWWRRLVGA